MLAGLKIFAAYHWIKFKNLILLYYIRNLKFEKLPDSVDELNKVYSNQHASKYM